MATSSTHNLSDCNGDVVLITVNSIAEWLLVRDEFAEVLKDFGFSLKSSKTIEAKHSAQFSHSLGLQLDLSNYKILTKQVGQVWWRFSGDEFDYITIGCTRDDLIDYLNTYYRHLLLN